ncbi:MAG: LiaF transmembrane domain-containing protein [Candidatus Cryptobacteroides sp.]
MKNHIGPRVVWGTLFLVAGVLWILSITGAIHLNVFFKGWWSLIIIAAGIISFFSPRSDRYGSVFIVAVGTLLLLTIQLDSFTWDMFWKLVLAVLIVLMGIAILLGTRKKGHSAFSPEETIRHDSSVNRYEVSFGARNIVFDGEQFNGITLKASFGALRLDLRSARIESDCTIRLECSFAGAEIVVPEGINIDIRTDAAFGGVSDKRHCANSSQGPTIRIEGSCSFGGVEIRNN